MAKRMRAEMFHDKIVSSLDDVLDKEEVAAESLKWNKLKHLASVNDPETFGTRQKLVGDAKQPLQIIVDTGIRRKEDG